jgi:hypothetical protein
MVAGRRPVVMAEASADATPVPVAAPPWLPRFGDALQIVSGTPDSGGSGLAVFAVIRDEMFFLPAFLAHHRQLGVSQFLVLDDGSSDGSAEYLAAQSDCVVLRSPLSYAERVRSVDLAGRQMERRACFFFKQYIPELWLRDRIVLALDADEFLLLPPEIPDADALLAALERHRISSVGASLLEFFPPQLSDLEDPCSPGDLSDLLRHAPCYDHAPLTRFRWRGGLAGIRPSASTRIFRQAGIAEPYTTTPFKVPLYQHQRNWIVGSHQTRCAPDRRVLLTLAHFKFTHDLYRRTRMAIELQSHSQGSRKYRCYAELFERSRRGDLALEDASTRHFSGCEALRDAGLLVWRLSGGG